MPDQSLANVVPDRIWTLHVPVWFAGVRLRARSTVVRLEDGSLLFHSPAPPDERLAEALSALGSVRWLLVPNCFHQLGAPAASERFPEARVVGPSSASARNERLRLHLDIRGAAFAEQLPEIEALPLDGVPYLDETVLYHRPTATLLGADIVLRADAGDHWTFRWAGRVTGCYEQVRVPPDVRRKIVDKAAAARSLSAMLERPAKRLVVGHSQVIEDACREQLAEAWRREGVPV